MWRKVFLFFRGTSTEKWERTNVFALIEKEKLTKNGRKIGKWKVFLGWLWMITLLASSTWLLWAFNHPEDLFKCRQSFDDSAFFFIHWQKSMAAVGFLEKKNINISNLLKSFDFFAFFPWRKKSLQKSFTQIKMEFKRILDCESEKETFRFIEGNDWNNLPEKVSFPLVGGCLLETAEIMRFELFFWQAPLCDKAMSLIGICRCLHENRLLD